VLARWRRTKPLRRLLPDDVAARWKFDRDDTLDDAIALFVFAWRIEQRIAGRTATFCARARATFR